MEGYVIIETNDCEICFGTQIFPAERKKSLGISPSTTLVKKIGFLIGLVFDVSDSQDMPRHAKDILKSPVHPKNSGSNGPRAMACRVSLALRGAFGAYVFAAFPGHEKILGVDVIH